MKKVISFLLCICFMFGICPVNVVANEVQTKYLQVSVNDKVQTYECLWDAKEIFCSVEDLGEITNYDWTQMEDGLEFQFYREYENDNGDYGIELQTSVLVEVDDNKKTAEIDAMGESYSVNCYIKDEEVFLPLEKLLYLLHAEWTIDDNMLCVVPMPLTILDFMAIHSIDLAQIESTSEDVLIDTGWLFSDNEWGQAVYSAIAEVFSDFDGKIFMLWWPGEGHVETAECYENAILQLAKEDEEFIGEDVQSDAMEVIVDSIFSINSESTNKIQNIISVPSNIDDLVQSVPDAVSVLEDLSETFPNIEVSQKVKNVSEKIKNGQIDSSFLEIPEMKSKADELGKIGDGLAILQCVWNAYDVANRVEGWNEEYLSQLDVLANYNNPGSINENVVDYVQSSAQRLIDSYNNPTQAVTDEALQSTMGLLLSKTFEESPFGKVFSIIGAVGTCYGTFDVETAETYDVYSELSVVTFSIKIEQLVRELFRYEDILTTTEKLTSESIEEARDRLMLYLRLNLRNKAQLYNLNLRGNENKNWSESEEAKKLYDEIVKVYAMLAELIETKDYDSRIIISSNLDDIHSTNPAISEEILLDEMNNSEIIYAEILDMFYNCIQSGWTEYNEMPTLYGEEFCYLFPMYYSNSSYIDKIGYSFIDLNGDGVEELLIGMDADEETQYGDIYQNMIYDLYTYMNDKVVHLATSGERFVYQLCEDNTIYYWGSGGAASTAYYHYQLSPDAPILSILESIHSEPTENWENIYWYYSTSGLYNPETYSNEGEEFVTISEDEANAIKDAWPQNVDFSLTYFSEYTPQNK